MTTRLSLSLALASVVIAAASRAQRPNIILMLTDDPDSACLATPNGEQPRLPVKGGAEAPHSKTGGAQKLMTQCLNQPKPSP